MKKNLSFLQLKTLCLLFGVAFFGLLMVGLILIFASRKQAPFLQSTNNLQRLTTQSDSPTREQNFQTSQSEALSCAATTDGRYQQWWEEVLHRLIPKLIEHKVTTVYYGVKRATYYKDFKWKVGNWLSADRLFFNVAANNYYGAKEYSSYQDVPNEIKCQLPSFLFQPNRVKTLKSLKIYLDVLLPRLANYKKHPPDKYTEWDYADQFSITQLLTKTEQEIFTLTKTKNWGSKKWQIAFYYLAVLDISEKIRNDYLQRVDDYFINNQFWLNIQPAWKKLTNDQLLTTWRGNDVTSLKKEANLVSYSQLNPANQIVLKRLMKMPSSELLITQITILADHLTKLDAIWKELQTLHPDLEKYSISQLEKVQFSNLKAHLATSDPAKLPSQAKTELLNLLEIDDFVAKLKEILSPLKAAAARKAAAKKILIIVLSTVLPLIVFGLVGGTLFYFKKKSKTSSPKPKK